MKTALLLLTIALTGCAAGPRVLEIQLDAEPSANQGHVVEVRIYRLKSALNISSVSATSFWNSDGTALGDELLSEQRLLVYPGGHEVTTIPCDPSVHAIAVAANFAKPHPILWRAIVDTRSKTPKRLAIRIFDGRIESGVPE